MAITPTAESSELIGINSGGVCDNPRRKKSYSDSSEDDFCRRDFIYILKSAAIITACACSVGGVAYAMTHIWRSEDNVILLVPSASPGLQRGNSGCKVAQQMPSPSKPSCQPVALI